MNLNGGSWEMGFAGRREIGSAATSQKKQAPSPSAQNLYGQSGNRTLTDVVTAGDAALRLTRFEALAGLLLVKREDRLAAEFDAISFGVGSAARGAFELRRGSQK